MHRAKRRAAILGGKRNGAFDTHQYYYEKARRTKVTRQVRNLLRRTLPVVLVVPRWSQAQRFLDDIASDLLVGEPAVQCRTLSLVPLDGRTQHQAWSWLVSAVTGFCRLDLDGPAWQAVSRHGFRHVMEELLERAEAGQRRCLMIHGVEHIHLEAIVDFIEVFEAHRRKFQEDRRFNLLLAGTVEAVHFGFEDTERVVLPDFSDAEAIEVLVEHLGPLEHHRLESVVELVGGVPAILDALGAVDPTDLNAIVNDREAVWRILGHLAVEIRGAYEIVSADDQLSHRLELIARDGPLPREDNDQRLVSSGLVREVDRGRRLEVRAPVFGDLAQA